MKCAECGQDFESQRSLHAHLKAHKLSLEEYYEKHYPRFDAYSGDRIRFKNLAHYEQQFFAHQSNLKPWFEKASDRDRVDMINKLIKSKTSDKGLQLSPSTLYFQSYEIFNRLDMESVTEWGEICLDNNWINIFYQNAPKDFWVQECQCELLVDTREQKPWSFGKMGSVSVKKQKLDFGDYTRADMHDGTFVERKSLQDFIGTITQNRDRFYEEMDRAVDMGCFMFVIVEASVDNIYNYNSNNKYRINLNLLWHEIRELMTKYPKNLQLVFAQNRIGAEKITARILQNGRALWRVDVQHELDKRLKIWHGPRESKA
jgi:hypothetical protein